MSRKIKDLIWALALENSTSHGGRALTGPVIGKIVSIRPDLRDKVKEVISIVEEVVSKVNSLSLSEQEELLKKYSAYLPERRKVEERIELPPLPKAERGMVVTRFSPNPDFILHLGSARAAILSHDYARLYDGKFILRFEDTDPRTKKPKLEYYDAIRSDLRWLGCDWDEEYVQSSRLKLYYEVARELVEAGKAYVCTCSREKFRKYVSKSKSCPCRNLSEEEQLNRFKGMLNGEYGEGEAVLRIKTDLKHPNPSVRDWPALRIIDTKKHPHPLTGDKFNVWPLYNFSCAVDDHYLGVTHVIRGVEHKINELRQKYVFDYMRWQLPVMIHHGKLGLTTGVLSKSKMLAGVRTGMYKGYDDPRLATLISLRRRGFQPEVIRRIIHEVGLNPSTAIIDWKLMESYNRQIIDPKANRRFVVLKPYLIKIRGISIEVNVSLRLHPDFPKRGLRKLVLKPRRGVLEVFIDKGDASRIGIGKPFRLMGFANLLLSGMNEGFGEADVASFEVSKARELGAPFLHWVPANNYVNVKMILSDAREINCVAEPGIIDEEIGGIIQMERVGYAKVELKGAGWIQLVYTHS